jgi:uncharacterized protein (DUF2141 family)
VATVAASAPSATLEVSVAGLRSAKGNVLVCLTSNPKFFPDCGKDPAGIKRAVTAAQARLVHFDAVTPGRYAIALIHDENANNKMDMAIFLPREGFGFSRNPMIVMGPPKFSQALFPVIEGGNTQAITIKYML